MTPDAAVVIGDTVREALESNDPGVDGSPFMRFLLDRVADDARRIFRMEHLQVEDPYYGCPAALPDDLAGDWGRTGESCTCGLEGRQQRARADLEAKRLLVYLYLSAAEAMSLDPNAENWAALTTLGSVLRIVASVYADHPDYQQEWKP